MAQTLEQKIVDHVAATSALIEKAASAEQARQLQEKASEDLIPQVVTAMVDNGRILPREAEKLAKVLRDPVKALEVLMKTAEHRSDAEQIALGQPQAAPGAVKKASYNSLTSPYAGLRTSSPKESDLAFLARLGLAQS